MRFLVGADVDPNPDSGAAGTVYHTNRALETLGCVVDEIWKQDLGRRINHGNLHYLMELPRAYRREVASRCRSRRYDAVMLSQPHAFLAAKYIQRQYPRSLFINRSHGWEGQVDGIMEALNIELSSASPLRRAARNAMQRLLARHQTEVVKWSDGMVVGSSPVAAYLESNYGVPRDHIAVVPHGIPEEYLAGIPAAEDSRRWRKLLYVGQFTPIKAPDVVASVFNRVLTAAPDVEAGWVCDPAHHQSVRDMLSPEIRDRVSLHAWMNQHDLIGLYDAYGLFVFPSHYEGFGKTPFEAMARGMAVVSARVGGMVDLIRTGENGFLTEPGNCLEMADVILHLLNRCDEAIRCGQRARETARNLTWENTAREIIRFVEKLMTGKHVGMISDD